MSSTELYYICFLYLGRESFFFFFFAGKAITYEWSHAIIFSIITRGYRNSVYIPFVLIKKTFLTFFSSNNMFGRPSKVCFVREKKSQHRATLVLGFCGISRTSNSIKGLRWWVLDWLYIIVMVWWSAFFPVFLFWCCRFLCSNFFSCVVY